MYEKKSIEELVAEVEHHLVVIDELQFPALEVALERVRCELKQAYRALSRLEERVVEHKR